MNQFFHTPLFLPMGDVNLNGAMGCHCAVSGWCCTINGWHCATNGWRWRCTINGWHCAANGWHGATNGWHCTINGWHWRHCATNNWHCTINGWLCTANRSLCTTHFLSSPAGTAADATELPSLSRATAMAHKHDQDTLTLSARFHARAGASLSARPLHDMAVRRC
jgi:hypothetical protein